MGPFPIYCHYENDIRIGRILVNIWCVRDSFHQTWEPQKEILLANLHVLPTMGNICNGVVLSCKADFRPGPRHPQHLAIIVSIPDISPSFSPSPWLILNVLRSFRHLSLIAPVLLNVLIPGPLTTSSSTSRICSPRRQAKSRSRRGIWGGRPGGGEIKAAAGIWTFH